MIIPVPFLSPFAQNGDRTTVPQQDPNGFVNFSDGYTPFYEISLTANNPQAKAVERRAMNELFYQLSNNAMAWQQMTTAPWISGILGGYMTNAMVARDSSDGTVRLYRSLIDNNSSDPATNSSQWEVQPRWSSMRQSIPMPSGGSGVLDSSSEVISATSGVDSRLLTNGTWEFATDAAAQSAADMPSNFGSPVKRGMFESKLWSFSGSNYIVQRYSSIDGRVFTRGYDGSSWSSWTALLKPFDAQSGSMVYAKVAGTGNAFTASFTPSFAFSSLAIGAKVNLLFETPNTGPCTISVNGGAALNISNEAGNALSGGELSGFVTLGLGENRWFIETTHGIKSQISNAVAPENLVRLSQVQAMVGAIGNPEWNNVQNKPNVAIQGTAPNFTYVRLISPNPLIDLYFNEQSADFNFRIVNDADKQLSFMTDGSTSTVRRGLINQNGFRTDFDSSVGRKLILTGQNGGDVEFRTSAGVASKSIGLDSTGRMVFSRINSGVAETSAMMLTTGQWSFAQRPTFATGTPWDNGNFNPATKLTIGVKTDTQGTILSSPNVPAVASANGDSGWVPLQISNAGNGGASASVGFVRDGVYGLILGLDTDNVLKIGGWTMGNVSYPVLHSGNLSSFVGSSMASNAYNAVGQFGMFVVGGSGAGAPGTIVPGSSLVYCAAGWDGAGISPPGTWQLCGHVQDRDGTSGNSITIARRVS